MRKSAFLSLFEDLTAGEPAIIAGVNGDRSLLRELLSDQRKEWTLEWHAPHDGAVTLKLTFSAGVLRVVEAADK